MGAGCSRECHAAIREAEVANRRVSNVQRQLHENFVQSRKIQEQLERQYNDMVGTAYARIDSYRSRLDHVTREKESVRTRLPSSATRVGRFPEATLEDRLQNAADVLQDDSTKGRNDEGDANCYV